MNDIIEARKTGVNSLEIGRFLCILFQYSEVPKNSFRNVKLSCLRTALLPMEVLVHHTTLAGPPVSQMNFPFPFLGEVSILSIALIKRSENLGTYQSRLTHSLRERPLSKPKQLVCCNEN